MSKAGLVCERVKEHRYGRLCWTVTGCLLLRYVNTVKPMLETTCIKRPPALRDHGSDTTTLFKSTLPAFKDHML